jgi:NAD(P)-dependent dehydrogenase (short-subunit alcohol dehydrogenase family)
MSDYPSSQPPQKQDDHPGHESEMHPKPEYDAPWYRGSNKLMGKVALVSGGDSGIGRAVATLFAREGADVTIVYYDEHEDAKQAKLSVEAEGQKCILIAGDLAEKSFAESAVQQTIDAFGKLDVLVNNAAMQFKTESLTDISEEQLKRTFGSNVFGAFFLTQAALPHLKEGASIVNSTSIVAFQGNPMLIDYAATKGAMLAFTRSLAASLVDKGIRVNSVAPGPIWTPFIPAGGFSRAEVAAFGKQVAMGRAGQPEELAPAYVYLASQDSSYVTGQTIHVNGGTIVGG